MISLTDIYIQVADFKSKYLYNILYLFYDNDDKFQFH